VVSSYKHSRWDTHAHRLADFNYSDPTMEIYPGQDYSDARLRDFEQGNSQQVL
jgi:phospholipase D1/2